jgi:uncharacterized protein YegL
VPLIKRNGNAPTLGGVFAHLKQASKNVVATTGADLTLILDRSGSMAGEPLAQLNLAARRVIIDFLPKININVIPFDGVKVIPAQAFVEMRVKGGTPMGAALCKFVEIAQPGSHAILMSDGSPTDDHEIGVERCVEHRLVVHTVACGDGADEILLRDIAVRTGGTFSRATQPAQLTEVFLVLTRKAVAALTDGKKELPRA